MEARDIHTAGSSSTVAHVIRRNPAFVIALAVSTLFHLSMVSVFSIVIRFPYKEVPYCLLEIAPPVEEPLRMARREVLRMPSLDRVFETVQQDALTPEAGSEALPSIELPRLELADAGRLRTREESLKIRSEFTDLFERDEPTPDSWARFTQELRDISTTLSRWASNEPQENRDRRVRVISPAPGFEAEVTWMSEPKDRKVLFAAPILSLWNADPAQLPELLSVVFTVNPQGKVTEVQIPMEDEAGIFVDIRKSLLKYRFDPVDTNQNRDQRATFSVTAVRAAP